jgi:hypothetical protein
MYFLFHTLDGEAMSSFKERLVYFPFYLLEGRPHTSEKLPLDGSGVCMKRCCTLEVILETTYTCQLRRTAALRVWIFKRLSSGF